MDKGSWIWMDGEFVPWDEANVHVLTHTLHYGFGVFEGIRCYRQEDGGTAIFRLEEHNRRLFGLGSYTRAEDSLYPRAGARSLLGDGQAQRSHRGLSTTIGFQWIRGKWV